jgi:hypothetical protein
MMGVKVTADSAVMLSFYLKQNNLPLMHIRLVLD